MTNTAQAQGGESEYYDTVLPTVSPSTSHSTQPPAKDYMNHTILTHFPFLIVL